MSSEKAQIELKKIVDLFSSQELIGTFKKAYISTEGKPSKKWSMGNKIIMLMSGTSDARGYNQWFKVGRHVKKGTKAIYILGPKKVTIKKIDKTSGEESKEPIIVGFLSIPVFRYEDTDGIPLPEYKPSVVPKLLDVAAKWGIKVVYDTSDHGEYGSIGVDGKQITLSTEDVDTYFHELVHAGHMKFEKLKPGQYAEQEAIAQLGACVLAKMYGYDVVNDTYKYIALYAESNKPEVVGKLCLRVLAKVEKILDLILSTTDDKPFENPVEISA